MGTKKSAPMCAVAAKGRPGDLAALLAALARVLFVVGGDAALTTHFLTTSTGRGGHAGHGGRCGSAFAIGFGNDFVAHGLVYRVRLKTFEFIIVAF